MIRSGLLVVLLVPSVVGATRVTDADRAALTAAADVVVQGDVLHLRMGPDAQVPGRLVTHVTLRPQVSLKGQGDTFVVPGGTHAGYTQRFHGAPTFEVGETILAFLYRQPTGRLVPLGLSTGIQRQKRPAHKPFFTSHGHPTRWAERRITFVFDATGPEELGLDVWRDVFTQSASTWSALSCDSGVVPFEIEIGGIVDDARLGYFPGEPNDNLVTWIHDESEWLSRYSPNDIAVTSDMVVQETGEILDADMEINDARHRFVTDPSSGGVDIENTITHELGHALGLNHSPETEATMYFKAGYGQTFMRTLHDDDIAVYCSLYGKLGSQQFELVVNPPAPTPPGTGCHAAPATSPGGWVPLALLLSALCGVLAVRRGWFRPT